MSRLQKQPLLVYVPEVPAVPAVPAHCITYEVFAGYAAAQTGGKFGDGNVGGGGASYFLAFDAYGNLYKQVIGAVGGVSSAAKPIFKNVTECFPEVAGTPGTPARVDTSGSIGWNAGARSAKPIPPEGYFECRIPVSPHGIVVGLSDGMYDHSYGHASHAIAFRSSGMTPIRYGGDLAAAVPLAPGAVVRFERRNGMVTAFIDGDLFHAFSVPARGELYADVTLYGLSDYVDDAEIGALYAWVDGVIPAPVGRAGEAGYCGIDSVTPPMLLSALCRIVEGVTGYIPTPTGLLSDGGYARVGGRVPAMILSARSNPPEAVQSGVLGFVPPMSLYGLSLTGAVGGVDAAIRPPIGRLSQGSYCFVDSTWGGSYRLTAWEPYLPDNIHDGGDLVFAGDFGSLVNAVLFMAYDGVSITDGIDLLLLVSMEAYEYLGVGDRVTLGGVIRLLAMERVAITSDTRTAHQEALQYAVNVLTGALTTYKNFGFTQYARAGGETYAIKPDGMYRLSGDTDNGDTVSAMIDFGSSDYGTAQGKRLSSVFAGVTTDGEVYVRVTPDSGEERCYRAVGESPEFRAPVAKGLKARHWRVRLELTDATFADVDNIEIELGVSQRRLAQRRK